MFRQRTIVGIGEALLIERPEGVAAGGLALDVALAAQRAGHIGLPISRIGQDALANELATLLQQDEIDISHLQSDPDLKTGQLIIRRLGGDEQRRLDSRAAFDNLQWDFDLEDVAQQADGAVFGLLGCRDGQARSVHDRFLSECTAAIKVCDLTNADPQYSDNRGIALALLQCAEVAIADDTMLRTVVPGSGNEREQAMQALLREGDLTIAVYAQHGQPIELHSARQVFASSTTFAGGATTPVIVSVLHGLLAGWDYPEVIRCVDRVTTFASEQPAARIPDDVMQAK